MDGVVEVCARVAVLVFVVACMAAAGLGLGLRDVAAALRQGRPLALALFANFVIAPAVAWAVARAFGLDSPYATGLVLLGAAAGAPFLPKLAEIARGDVAYSVGLMLLLTIGSTAFLPVALPRLAPGLSADPWTILRPILVTMLLPLAVGMTVRGGSDRLARRLRPPVVLASNVALAAAVVLLVAVNLGAMLDTLGSGAVLAALVFVASMAGIGYAVGGPVPTTRSVVGLGTGQRNVAAALTVAGGNSDDPRVVIMVLVSTFAGLVVLVPAARLFGRRTRMPEESVDHVCGPERIIAFREPR